VCTGVYGGSEELACLFHQCGTGGAPSPTKQACVCDPVHYLNASADVQCVVNCSSRGELVDGACACVVGYEGVNCEALLYYRTYPESGIPHNETLLMAICILAFLMPFLVASALEAWESCGDRLIVWLHDCCNRGDKNKPLSTDGIAYTSNELPMKTE
jgi:hypothetical protein